MDWITDQVAIGNYIDAGRLMPGEVNAVLCLKPDCCDDDSTDFDILCVPLIDGRGNSLDELDDAVEFIREIVASGEKVLVHCHAGRSRSVVVVARYLMKYEGMTSLDTLKLISSKREVCITSGMDKWLTQS